ncbi:hypothetical protein QBC47DRAFT_376642 [Echria macrotheca]|uniref:Uncharacterized protein n=1 Tax=Echria macrotheca TaxID=438768 RepID=A0AAJ0BG51_9PEZI|nr:hypothetical protein QBC47DRAFT_376642 [Echria macrotheca]
MACASDPTVEILVHIAAPARAVNDVDYRKLARSYLHFDVETKTNIYHGGSDEQTVHLDGGEDEGNMASADQALIISTPDISFQSAFGNMASPHLRHAQAIQVSEDGPPESQSSWVAPPSVVQDSLPENNVAIAQFCSPTRILEHYISGFESSQSETSPVRGRKTLSAAAGSERNAVPSSQLTRALPSEWDVEIPDTQPSDLMTRIGNRDDTRLVAPVIPTPPTNKKFGAEDGHSGNRELPAAIVIPRSPPITKENRPPLYTPESTSFIEETRFASSFLDDGVMNEAAVPSRAGSEPPAKRARISPTSPRGKALERSSSDVGPRQDHAKTKTVETRKLDHVEILTPAPAASVSELQPADMITDTLAVLAEKLQLAKRYRPQSQTRELRPFERGYWRLDCQSWDEMLKRNAWGFLTDYLTQRDVGWGIACKRDRDFTWIRLYCWGCVVGHMYLVLWLASERRAKIGMEWVAGDGEVVVVTGARSGSQR